MSNSSNLSVAPDEASIDIDVDLFKAVKSGLSRLQRVRIPKVTNLQHFNPIERKLIKLEAISDEVLFKTRGIFPFDFFPDTVVIDKEKLTIAQRIFFFTGKIISVPMRDLLSVQANVGPIFGSIQLTSRYFFTNPQSIKFIWRSHALKMQRLLQGFIIATERNIDCSSVDKTQLLPLLEHLGRVDVK